MGTKIKFVNMQKIVLALLVAAVSAKSVALPEIKTTSQLLDFMAIPGACEQSSTGSATGSAEGSGSEEACTGWLSCIKNTDGKYTINCETSACKEGASCLGKQMCKAAANAKDPAKCRKAIEGAFESNCDAPTVVIIIVIVVVVLLLGVGVFCYCRRKNA